MAFTSKRPANTAGAVDNGPHSTTERLGRPLNTLSRSNGRNFQRWPDSSWLHAAREQWDTNAWALNTPNGIIDLRTGEQFPHRPGDYITKTTAVAPDRALATPIWFEFLNRVTGGNAELIGFLQRTSGWDAFAGYALALLIFERIGVAACCEKPDRSGARRG
jgi:phage/plasmid-associated DNA primase